LKKGADMKRLFLFALLFYLSGCAGDGNREQISAEGITVTDQWARPGIKNRNTAVFLKITNNTSADDTLYGANSQIAKVVEIHETYEKGNDMKGMRQVENLIIPAGSTVELKPGGFHIMLIGLNSNLTSEQVASLTLSFKSYGAIKIDAQVK
jgi:copper(I)-binding protein